MTRDQKAILERILGDGGLDSSSISVCLDGCRFALRTVDEAAGRHSRKSEDREAEDLINAGRGLEDALGLLERLYAAASEGGL